MAKTFVASMARGLGALLLITLALETQANRARPASPGSFRGSRTPRRPGAPGEGLGLLHLRRRRLRLLRGLRHRRERRGQLLRDVRRLESSHGKQAVVIASICEFFGALLMGSNVAKTIRKGIADVNCYKDNPGLLIYGMTCVIIAVAIWLVLASYLELPVSTTHSCVGGIIGMTLMTRSTRCVIWNKDPDNMAFENFPWTGGVAQIVISWVLSPVASGVCAAALYAVVRYGIFAWENCYLRARIAFPLVVFFTVTVNVTYFIVKGAKGQAERFGTVGMVREAKEEGNLAPAIGMGAIFGAVAAAVAAAMLPMLSKKVEAEDFTDSVARARADPADVEAKAVDAEAGAAAGAAAVDAEATELDGAKAYIGGQLTRDTHKDLKTDKVVGAIHASRVLLPLRPGLHGDGRLVLARCQRRGQRHGPLRGRLPRVQEGRGPVEAGDARRGHAVDPGARWCRYRGGPGDVRLQDHERHGRWFAASPFCLRHDRGRSMA